MTRLTLSDFGILYDALAAKQASVPVKLLRRFKEEMYTYVVTSKPGPLMKVGQIDDKILMKIALPSLLAFLILVNEDCKASFMQMNGIVVSSWET